MRRDYLGAANDEVCLLVQAQTTTALYHLQAICEVDGVDGVFIGPADLAASMGHRGAPGHPEVQAAIELAIRTIVASGKAAGTLTGDPALARRYLELCATLVAVGIELVLMVQAARRLAGEFGLGTKRAMSVGGGAAYLRILINRRSRPAAEHAAAHRRCRAPPRCPAPKSA